MTQNELGQRKSEIFMRYNEILISEGSESAISYAENAYDNLYREYYN